MTQLEIKQELRETYKSMLISKKQTGKEIHVSTGTIDELRRQGKLKSRKVLGQVMFDIGEVARFIAEA